MNLNTNLTADPVIISVAQQHQQLAARTANLKILSSQAFTEAAEWLKTIKSSLKQIEDARVAMTRPINEGLRAINDQAKAASAPYLEIEAKIKNAILVYTKEQERIRIEEQRKRDAEAAAEKKRLQEIADRAAAESRRKAQEQREAAERAEREGRAAEAARLAAAAAKTEEKGLAKQEQFESRASAVVAPVLEVETPKVAGVGMRDNWTYRIKDPAKINPQFMVPDTVKIGKIVKSLKSEAASVIGPGVEVFNDQIIASGRAT